MTRRAAAVHDDRGPMVGLIKRFWPLNRSGFCRTRTANGIRLKPIPGWLVHPRNVEEMTRRTRSVLGPNSAKMADRQCWKLEWRIPTPRQHRVSVPSLEASAGATTRLQRANAWVVLHPDGTSGGLSEKTALDQEVVSGNFHSNKQQR